MPDVIDAHDLHKSFGPVTAVDGVSLTVSSGEIFGFLGPNAAGKSTTIRLLSGIMQFDGGDARVLGYDLARQREALNPHIGYVAQQFALYPELTVAENMAFYAGIYDSTGTGVQKNLLKKYGLLEYAQRRAGHLSGGYKRRLSLACALVHDPALIFLDEPTAGIDPVTRKEIWDLFYQLVARGKTLFVTTHYMEEAERCHRLAFINHGRLVASGTPAEIRGSLGNVRVFTYRAGFEQATVDRLRTIDGILLLNQFGDELRIVTDDSVSDTALAGALGPDNAGALHMTDPNIEDVFMVLTRETP